MKRILVTRPRSQSDSFAAKLKAAGFEPILFPVIEISPVDDHTVLERALSRLECYDWVVFTSANGVTAVWEQMQKQGLKQIPKKVRVAAIGPKTAGALKAHGISPSFVPEEFIAEAILRGLGDLRGRWVLLPRAEIAREALPNAIKEAGGMAHEIAVYHTLPANADAVGLNALKTGVDVVTFTSPSTVHHFVQTLRQNGLDPFNLPSAPKIACIGPITQKAAEDEGFKVTIVAQDYTSEGLIEALSRSNI